LVNDGLAARRLGALRVFGTVVVVAVTSAGTVVVVVVVATRDGAGAARRRILLAILGLPILGTRREVAGNFFDAVLARCGAVDKISCPASATAALNVRRLGHVLGLPRTVPWCVAVFRHGDGGALYPLWAMWALEGPAAGRVESGPVLE
jgi:hypothetical protein